MFSDLFGEVLALTVDTRMERAVGRERQPSQRVGVARTLRGNNQGMTDAPGDPADLSAWLIAQADQLTAIQREDAAGIAP